MAEGVLNAVTPIVDNSGVFHFQQPVPRSSSIFYQTQNPASDPSNPSDPVRFTTRSISTSHLVFLFVSDIGQQLMGDKIVIYGGRELVPAAALRNAVRSELLQVLPAVKTAKEIVPFLPLEMRLVTMAS